MEGQLIELELSVMVMLELIDSIEVGYIVGVKIDFNFQAIV